MSDAIELLLTHLDYLKLQHDAGINPERDDIKLLFDLHGQARKRRDREVETFSLRELDDVVIDHTSQDAPAAEDVDARPRTPRVTDVDIALGRRRGASRRRRQAVPA